MSSKDRDAKIISLNTEESLQAKIFIFVFVLWNKAEQEISLKTIDGE